MENGETLAQLVQTRYDELGESLRQLADHGGGLITFTEIDALRKGRRVDISEAKIIGLARALRVSEERVRKAIETSKTQHPLELPGRLNLLSPDMKAALVAVGDSLLDLQRKLTSQDKPARTAAVQAHGRRRKSSAR